MANAQFAAGDHADAIATLDYLREKNPGFRSADGHLVYARALEESGATERALEEYAALVQLLSRAPRRACARRCCYKKLGAERARRGAVRGRLNDARLAPKHFRRSQREWIELAEARKRLNATAAPS